MYYTDYPFSKVIKRLHTQVSELFGGPNSFYQRTLSRPFSYFRCRLKLHGENISVVN